MQLRPNNPLIATYYLSIHIIIYWIGLRSSSESRLPPKLPPSSPVDLSLWNCSEHLIGTSGQFSPPDNPYKSNTDCVWAIEAPEGHCIQLRMDGIDLEWVYDYQGYFDSACI